MPRLDDFDRFQFVGWEIENVVYNIDSNFKYTMPAYDVVANAVWNDKIVHITNRSEFIAMVKSNSNDGYYVLDNDITLSSWSPLSGCIGYFDGNGHKITINTSKNYAVSGKCYYGIFGNLTNSTVINLRIFAGISITTSGSDNNDRFFAGGLCGRSNNSTIKNVSVSGNIKTSQSTSDSGTTIAGGIVGYSNNSEIVDCSNEAYINITKCSAGAGGICGYAEENTKFTNCVNNGGIYTTGYGGVLGIGQGVSSAGGICAFSYGSIKYYNCYNYGSLTAEWGRTSSDDICAYPNCDWMV